MTTQTVSPKGFVGLAHNLGVKDDSADFALVVSEVPAVSAAVFTQSRFAGPSVLVCRSETQLDACRGVVAISKNANVATGAAGLSDAREVREAAAAVAGVAPEELVIASTGVIGRRYPMDRLRAGLAELRAPLPPADFDKISRAIMTTDTHPKRVTVRCGDAVIVGVAKGVGMIEPNMATLLTFFFTDAEISADELGRVFRRVVDRTFNALSIDTDTSTSDTAAIFANGLAGEVDLAEFERALYDCALQLVRFIASDGEGSTKLIEARVSGAASADQARRAAKSIVNSPLVKTAVHGADPNWGRIAMAVGKLNFPEDAAISPETVRITIGETELFPAEASQLELDAVVQHLSGSEILLTVDLGIGGESFTAYGCDLSEGYVRINADYTT